MLERKYDNKTIILRDTTIKSGEYKLVKMYIDRLPTGTEISIPVHVFNGKEAGPTILVQGGLHGDEINGTELIRRMLVEKHFNVKKGCVIVIPLLNVFGFIHFSREVYGKDVNRKFPGTSKGSLASRIAYYHTKEILSEIDFGIDFHTGGDQRNNYPQIRYSEESEDGKKLAEIFNAPINFASSLINNSFRKEAHKVQIPIIVFEGGESMRLDEKAIVEGISGTLNILKYFDMIDENIIPVKKPNKSISIRSRRWIRADSSGIFDYTVKNGSRVKKGTVIGNITDTYGESDTPIVAPFSGYIISVNNLPVVNQGDALINIGKKELKKKQTHNL